MSIPTLKSSRNSWKFVRGVWLPRGSYDLSDRKVRKHEVNVPMAIYDAYPAGRKFSVLVSNGDYRSEPYFSFTGLKIADAPKRSFV